MNPHFEDKTIDYYDRNADDFFNQTVDVDMSGLYAPFLEQLPAGGKILDAGCGSGRDSLYFKQMGFDITAFDASKELAQKASTLTNLDVFNMRFEDVRWIGEFDGIWACASLLHVPKKELKNILRILLKALKNEGIIYASFKKGTGEELENELFFSYYSKEELSTVFQQIAVCKIIKCWETRDIRKTREDQIWINLLVKIDF